MSATEAEPKRRVRKAIGEWLTVNGARIKVLEILPGGKVLFGIEEKSEEAK